MASDIILESSNISLTGQRVSVQGRLIIGKNKNKTLINHSLVSTDNINVRNNMQAKAANIGNLNISTIVSEKSVPGKIKIGEDRNATTLTEKLIETVKIRAGEVKGSEGSFDTLEIAGDITARKFTTVSDARCKQDINVLSDSLSKINCLQGVSFNWKENELTGANPARLKQIGFLAQDVDKVLPESVSKDENGQLSVDYTSIIPLLVEGMKTLQENIQLQGEQIKSKSQENRILQQKIVEIESKLDVLLNNRTH